MQKPFIPVDYVSGYPSAHQFTLADAFDLYREIVSQPCLGSTYSFIARSGNVVVESLAPAKKDEFAFRTRVDEHRLPLTTTPERWTQDIIAARNERLQSVPAVEYRVRNNMRQMPLDECKARRSGHQSIDLKIVRDADLYRLLLRAPPEDSRKFIEVLGDLCKNDLLYDIPSGY